MTIFVFENTEGSHQRRLFTVLGVDYRATSRAWMNLPLMAIVGIVMALVFVPVEQLPAQILVGIGYGLLIIVSSFSHGLGHIISGRIVNAPMKSLIATATVHVTHYDDTEGYPSRVHVGRSLGGPALNLVLGLVAIAIYVYAVKNHFLLFFGIVNLIFAAFTLLPIPSLDGDVILRQLRDWKK